MTTLTTTATLFLFLNLFVIYRPRTLLTSHSRSPNPRRRRLPDVLVSKKSPTNKKVSPPLHSEAASPWTEDERALLISLKSNKTGRPSWKAFADRLKRSEPDVRNQCALIQANLG